MSELPYPDPIPNHLIPEMSDRVCELVGNDLDAMGKIVMADVNAGLLYVMAISSIGVYGVILAGGKFKIPLVVIWI